MALNQSEILRNTRNNVAMNLGPVVREPAGDDARHTYYARQDQDQASKPYKILIADDAVVGRQALKCYFENCNTTLTFVENGALAVEAVQQAASRGELFDIVLMDMVMPVMDGHQATRKLRDLGYTLPIIALSGGTSEAEQAECLASGCDDFAEKSGEIEALLMMIYRLVPKH